MKQRFLIAYDYGQGGIWRYLLARSRQEVEEQYPELVIFDRPPDWMTPEWLARLEADLTVDIDDSSEPFLRSPRDQRL